MNKPTLAIISSVPIGGFNFVSSTDPRFLPSELASAQKSESQAFVDAIDIAGLQQKIDIQVIHAIEGIPSDFSADAYILGGSPSMVTDREKHDWINRLHRFVRQEVESGKPLFGICFGHQVLAQAFGGKVDYMKERKIGPSEIVTKNWETIQSLWSHKQAVYTSGEAQIMAQDDHWDGVIQMIQVGDRAHGVQFHPEFTPEFTAFLVRLMKDQISEEGWDPDTIIDSIYRMGKNPSADMLKIFIQKYYNL